MSILSFMRRWLTVQPASVSIGGHDVPSGERVAEEDVLALSAAYACTRLIGGIFGCLPAQVLQDVGDGLSVPVRDHPLFRVLHDSPNDEQTSYDFFEEAAASLELKGNALARRELTGGRTVALEPMHWDMTRVWRNSDGELRYDYDGQTLKPEEVVHIRGFGTDRNRLGGKSTISVAASAFGLAKAVNRSAGAVFKNGIRTSIALSAGKDLTIEQINETQKLVEEKYGGAMNAGRPLLLNHGFTPVPLMINPEDAQMLQSRGFSVEEVCRFFGVPPHMIGHTSGNTKLGSSISEQTWGFHKFSIGPRVVRMEKALTKQLMTAEDIARGFRIGLNIEGLLRAVSKERAEFYGSAIDKGWMSRNEVRRKENLPPTEGGDVITVQMQQVPLGAQPPAAS